jgi:hypothetical protein
MLHPTTLNDVGPTMLDDVGPTMLASFEQVLVTVFQPRRGATISSAPYSIG